MKKLLLIISVFMVFSACSKLEDLNKNTKDFTVVPGEALYNGATRALINQMYTPNVNSNNTQLYVQYWTTTTYTDEPRYDMVTRPIPANHMNVMYRNVLMNYTEALKAFAANPILQGTPTSVADQLRRDNQIAIIEIMSVYAWSNLVETFGNMPYTEAFDFTKPTPVYDDALTIYKDLVTRLNTALGKMTATSPGMTGTIEAATAYDNIFGGTAAGSALWIKFGNALKLRMGLMMADLDPAYAKTIIESAAPNVFAAGEKAAMKYLGASPNTNPFYTELVTGGRADFVLASTMIDAMQPTTPASSILNVTVADPRLPFYASPVGTPAVFKGGTAGEPNNYNSFSHVSPNLYSKDIGANREVVIMDYSETEFLLAEAAERGFTVGGTAETHYNNAVTASILYWGGTDVQAAAYLAQPTVAYATAEGNWKQKIGTQAWLSYFMRGMTSWTSYRRLDYPVLVAPIHHVEFIDKVPVRYTYAVSEQTLNGANYTAAAAAIGGDKPWTKLFWDKY